MFTGIVEEVGEITGLRQSATSTVLGVRASTVLGGTKLGDSIAVNGVSLTVSGLGDDWLQVDVIPTTAAETNLGLVKVGDAVNLESDVLGKYAIRRAETVDENVARPASGGLTLEKLAENGFL